MRFRVIFLKSISHIICFLYAITSTLYAQQLDFFKYGVEKGLSQETINTILKDSDGFLWLGTQDGLNRFDGHTFKVFKSQKNNPKSISGNFINALVEDEYGNIWVATKNNGICYYSPKTDEFTKIVIPDLPNNVQCNKLSLDGNGHIFASFLDQGLAIISTSKDKIGVTKIPFFDAISANITALKIIKKEVWIGTREGEIYSSNISNTDYNFQKLDYNFKAHKIHSFYAAPEGLWIGTDNGLSYLNKNTNQINTVSLQTNKTVAVFDMAIKNNQLFLATDTGFFWCDNFKESTNTFIQVTIFDTNSSEETGLLTNRINCIYVENNFLWLGADKLYQSTLKKPVFGLVQKNKPQKNTLQNEHVYTFAKSEHGLWAGTLEGLHLITKNKTYHYNNLPHNTIRSIAIDSKKHLWIGTQKGLAIANLNSFNPEKPNFYIVEKHPIDSLSLSNPKIRNIHTDTNGEVWITTLGGGTHRFIGDRALKKYTFQQFKNDPNNSNSISTNVNYVFYKDHSNTYWIGTENGLNRLQFSSKDFINPKITWFKNEEGNLESISNNTVLSIFEDSDHTLWVGTLNGINKYNPKTETFKCYNEDNGLTNGVVYAIQQDQSGLLWLSTNAGIFSFDTNKELFTNYNSNDGLQGNEFNLGGSYIDDNGILYFGGANGYNYFNPFDIPELDKEGQLTFTNVKINNTNQYFKALINKNKDNASKIELEFDQFPFYLEFSDLDFNPQKNNSYVYKLLPNDTDWNDLQDRKEIQFLNMASGDYTLLVQGKTRGKIWSSDPLKLALKVTPPWWKTHLAYVIYALLFLSFISALYYFQLQKKLQEQQTQKLKELDALKTKLYTNITHEFRTPLTVIKGVASNLSDRFVKNKDHDSIKSLKTIERLVYQAYYQSLFFICRD